MYIVVNIISKETIVTDKTRFGDITQNWILNHPNEIDLSNKMMFSKLLKEIHLTKHFSRSHHKDLL